MVPPDGMLFFERTLEVMRDAMKDFVGSGKYKWGEAAHSFQLFPGEVGIEQTFPEGFFPFVQAKTCTDRSQGTALCFWPCFVAFRSSQGGSCLP